MITNNSRNLGFPRMGKRRELKFAVEKCWANPAAEPEFLTTAQQLRKEHWKLQMKGQFMSVKMRTALPKMLLLSTLAYIAPASQAGQCSLSGTAGNYGLTLTGT